LFSAVEDRVMDIVLYVPVNIINGVLLLFLSRIAILSSQANQVETALLTPINPVGGVGETKNSYLRCLNKDTIRKAPLRA
jgi:hypothetical protein